MTRASLVALLDLAPDLLIHDTTISDATMNTETEAEHLEVANGVGRYRTQGLVRLFNQVETV